MRQRIYHSAWVPIVALVAFLGATSYCTFEVLAVPTTPQSEAPHHHDGSDQHHDGNLPTRGNDDAAGCCATIQAILASKLDIQFGSVTTLLLHSLAPQVLWSGAVIEPSHLANGLRPPVREPTPTIPFYRTTFASHAPPAFLA